MSDRQPNITVPVDLTNPGQFFACCGLLELADRLWPDIEGWFEQGRFCIHGTGVEVSLINLLTETRSLTFDVGDDSEDDESDDSDSPASVEPIAIRWANGRPALVLDWWNDKSIKPWAGSMKERVILRAMLDAINPSHAAPFSDQRRVLYQTPKPTKSGKASKPKKKEPFYFDPRRGNRSHPLDSGFSPDVHKMEAECCPALEALCFIGLQRARPGATSVANRSTYAVWQRAAGNRPGLAASLAGSVVSGLVQLPDTMTYVFDNYFRTDQRKHKTFSQATLDRSSNG
jgi:CRISPR-associated protein Csb3